MNWEPVPAGQIATIVTSLEMFERPRPAVLKPHPFRLTHWPTPDLDRYRMLFRRVGERWMWFSRLVMSDDQLRAIITDPQVRIYAVTDPQGIEVGLLELDFREAGVCELGFVGLIDALTGKGLGKWLLSQALMMAWRKDVTRVWVHTCTLDHPSALHVYRRAGFTPFAQAIERFPDPRLTGHMPRDAAPHVPLIEG